VSPRVPQGTDWVAGMISSEMIERARNIRIEDELSRRGIIKLRCRGRELDGPCPRCGGTDRFAVNLTKQKWNCRECKPETITGDIIGLIMWLDDCDFRSAVATLVGEPLSASKPDPEREYRQQQERNRRTAERDRQQREEERRRFQQAEAIWREAVAIADRRRSYRDELKESVAIVETPGINYLAERGITLDDVPEFGGLRFHPRCPWGQITLPCIVARFTDALTNAPLGIHRRRIDSRDKPLSLGPISGGVIRLWPDEHVAEGLVIGEGIETVLAAATRIEHHGTLLRPAWAAGSAGNLETFPILSGIESLTILVDHDANGRGQKAAQRCAERWADAGREVILLTPDDLGTDFNDLVRP
jgi:hypothetical protein